MDKASVDLSRINMHHGSWGRGRVCDVNEMVQIAGLRFLVFCLIPIPPQKGQWRRGETVQIWRKVPTYISRYLEGALFSGSF